MAKIEWQLRCEDNDGDKYAILPGEGCRLLFRVEDGGCVAFTREEWEALAEAIPHLFDEMEE